jgi:hypothetical protein
VLDVPRVLGVPELRVLDVLDVLEEAEVVKAD